MKGTILYYENTITPKNEKSYSTGELKKNEPFLADSLVAKTFLSTILIKAWKACVVWNFVNSLEYFDCLKNCFRQQSPKKTEMYFS